MYISKSLEYMAADNIIDYAHARAIAWVEYNYCVIGLNLLCDNTIEESCFAKFSGRSPN